MKFNFKFNTIGGPANVTYYYDELVGYDLQKYCDSIIAQRESGVVGGTYNTPEYGRVEINMVEE